MNAPNAALPLQRGSQVTIRMLLLVTTTVAAVSSLAALAGAVEFMFTDEITPGMRGVGRTVFEGTKVEDFEVEIVGIIENAYLEDDLIVGRCTGGPLDETGIMAGMSGSPVYIDGRLIGACAFAWSSASVIPTVTNPSAVSITSRAVIISPESFKFTCPGDLPAIRKSKLC